MDLDNASDNIFGSLWVGEYWSPSCVLSLLQRYFYWIHGSSKYMGVSAFSYKCLPEVSQERTGDRFIRDLEFLICMQIWKGTAEGVLHPLPNKTMLVRDTGMGLERDLPAPVLYSIVHSNYEFDLLKLIKACGQLCYQYNQLGKTIPLKLSLIYRRAGHKMLCFWFAMVGNPWVIDDAWYMIILSKWIIRTRCIIGRMVYKLGTNNKLFFPIQLFLLVPAHLTNLEMGGTFLQIYRMDSVRNK